MKTPHQSHHSRRLMAGSNTRNPVKKFILTRAEQLMPGDIIVMANALQITVSTVKVTGNTVIVRDTKQAIYQWAASYTCHVMNPVHPHYPENRLK